MPLFISQSLPLLTSNYSVSFYYPFTYSPSMQSEPPQPILSQPIQPIDPTEEIWLRQNPPKYSEIQQHKLKFNHDSKHQELNPINSQQIIPKSHQKPRSTSNPEFQTTIYSYPSEQNLAIHDHDREDLMVVTHRFDQACFVYRYKQQNDIMIDFLNEEEAQMGILPHENAEVLFQVKLQNSNFDKGKKFFTIIPESISESEDKKYKNKRMDKSIYKSIRHKGNYPDQFTFHELQKGDEIRFGLETFRVIEVELKPISERKEKKSVQIFEAKKDFFSLDSYLKKKRQATCKICLSTQDTAKDPLFNPCNCKGTCQYVHLNCLKTWIDSNLLKEPHKLVESYKWTKMECEICKVVYPSKIVYEDRILSLTDYSAPKQPYIVFQRMRSGCRKQILVVKGTEFPIHVGRNIDCDFNVSINTVSRLHAVIEFRDGQFYLKDLASRYGTLVRIKKAMRVEGKLKIQVGDILVRFDLVMKRQGKECVQKYN